MFPVDPDEFGQGEEALGSLIFFFPVSNARTSSEAVVGIGPRIAFEFMKKESFLTTTERQETSKQKRVKFPARKPKTDKYLWCSEAVGIPMVGSIS
jgi:hypothetical protein